jgi:hypothetical protein
MSHRQRQQSAYDLKKEKPPEEKKVEKTLKKVK